MQPVKHHTTSNEVNVKSTVYDTKLQGCYCRASVLLLCYARVYLCIVFYLIFEKKADYVWRMSFTGRTPLVCSVLKCTITVNENTSNL